ILPTWLGLPPSPILSLSAALRALLVTALLFLGPLAIELGNGNARPWVLSIFGELKTLIGVRNYVVGPLSEEFVFRACMVPLMQLAGFGKVAIVLGLPMFFGIAHLHHMIEYYNLGGRTSEALRRAVLVSALQFGYTTVFGWYSTFLFLRTGHLAAPLVSHMFCNVMGFPDFSVLQAGAKDRTVNLARFVIGVLLFATLLGPLTDPALFQSAYHGFDA
ncbi:hypothetical protein BDK51DRAFT_32475, partial [Blyttiomyces helicus]